VLRRAARLVPLVLAAVPPVLVAAAVIRHGLRVPFWDGWAFVPTLLDARDGTLTFADLWMQANEHRIVLPRLLLLALASLNRWDLRWELAAGLVLALAILGVLCVLVWRSTAGLAPPATPGLILAASMSTFSLMQYDNWLWGWQVLMFMEALGSVLVAWAVARWGAGWRAVAVGFLAATGAVLSFGLGITLYAVLPLGLLLAGRCRPGGGRRALGPALVAAAGGGLVLVLYRIGFHYPPHHPPAMYALTHPLETGSYALAYAGAGLALWSPAAAMTAGGSGIALFAWAALRCWRGSMARRRAALPWIMLGVDALAAAAVTAVGRAGFGVTQALAPRYVTASTLFWPSVAVLLALALADVLGSASRRRRALIVALATLGAALAAGSYAASWSAARLDIQAVHRPRIEATECVLRWDRAPARCLERLFPEPEVLRQRAAQLDAHRLGPFVHLPEWKLSSYAIAGAPGVAGHVEEARVTQGPAGAADIAVAGWASPSIAGHRVREVLVVADGRIMGRAAVGRKRPDVVEATGRPDMLRSGWGLRFAAFKLPPGPATLEAHALLDGRARLIPLTGSVAVDVP
jgi:hypothetical protein